MKKLYLIIAFLLAATSLGAVTFPSYWKSINCQDYGCVGDGSHDDTTAIQAAIDAAISQKIITVYLPPTGNCYKTTTSLFLDPPGNLRGAAAAWSGGTTYAINNTVTFAGVPWISLANGNLNHTPGTTSTFWAQTSAVPTVFNFEVALVGDYFSLGNHEGSGTRLCPNFNNAVALWVGPGQGNVVRGMIITGANAPTAAYRSLNPVNGIGIGVAGGNGGASRTLVEKVSVETFYTGIATSANGIQTLADSNTIQNAQFQNCAICISYLGTQNDINMVLTTRVQGTIGINSTLGRPVVVEGGDYSATSGAATINTIGTVSALSSSGCSFGCTWSFTAVVTAPDTNITNCPVVSGTIIVGGCIYTAWMIKTAHFGVVPMIMTQFDTSTNTATFAIRMQWNQFYLGALDPTTTTDLQAEIQAATTIYGTERIFTFYGAAFDVKGIWLENPTSCHTVLEQAVTFNASQQSSFKSVMFGADPGGTIWKNSAGTAQYAYFLCIQSFPFIEQIGGAEQSALFEGVNFGQSPALGQEPVIIDQDQASRSRLIFKNINRTLLSPNIRNAQCIQYGDISTSLAGCSAAIKQTGVAYGGGEWDVTPFWSNVTAGSPFNDVWPEPRVPFIGFFPDKSSVPRLLPDEITVLNSLGAIGTYSVMYGDQIYSVSDWNSGSTTNHWAKFAHIFGSYGQNFTITSWNTKGHSWILNVGDISKFFAGLSFTLDIGDGSGSHPYLVTGVYPALGYITVLEVTASYNSINAAVLTPGTKTTVFSCAAACTITQPVYSISQFP